MDDLFYFFYRDRSVVAKPLQNEVQYSGIMEECVVVSDRVAGRPERDVDLKLRDKSDIFPAVLTGAESS